MIFSKSLFHYLQDSPRKNMVLAGFYSIIILALYLFFHDSYMVENIDDAWTFSKAYNIIENGEVHDTIYGIISGEGGTSLFSRTYAYVYGMAGKLLGWTRSVGFGVSTLFLFLSVLLWNRIILRLGYDKRLAFWFALVMLILELYFGLAHKIRVEAISFFLATLSLYLFQKEQYFLSGLAGAIGIENHPYAIIFLFYILAYVYYIRKDIVNNLSRYMVHLLWFVSGGVAGIGYYLWLHHDYLGALSNISGRVNGNAFMQYFFGMPMSFRHWPELIVILISLGIFLYNRYWKEDRFILPWLAAVVVMSIFVPRNNFNYVIYLFPPVIMLMLYTFYKLKLLHFLLMGILLFQVPQYAILFYWNRNYDHREYIQTVREHVPDDTPFIYGSYNDWFAFYDKNFHAYKYFERAGVPLEEYPDEMILIENKRMRELSMKKKFFDRAGHLYNVEALSSFPYHDGSKVYIKRLTKKEIKTPQS